MDSGDTLLTILGDILDFSKIDHNSMVLESAPVRMICLYCLNVHILSRLSASPHAWGFPVRNVCLCLDEPLQRKPTTPGDGALSTASVRAQVCLRDTIGAVVEMVAADATKKGLNIAYTMDEVLLKRAVLGDAIRIRQVSPLRSNLL